MWGLSLKFVAKNKPCLVPPSSKDVEEVYLVDVFFGFDSHIKPECFGFFCSFLLLPLPNNPCMVYLPTCTINISQMLANIPIPWMIWDLLCPKMCFFVIGGSVYPHLHCQFWSGGLQGGTVQLENCVWFSY